MKYQYGMTLLEFDAMVDSQQNKCAICKKSNKLVVDHDHDTGKVRGLLCDRCNTALGALGDTHASITRVLSYLDVARHAGR